MRERLSASPVAEFVDPSDASIAAALRKLDEWILTHIAEFAPFNWQTPDEAETRRKAFSELALYAHVRTLGGVVKGDALKRLVEHLEHEVCSQDFIELIKRDQINFILYAAPIAFLRTLGKAPAELVKFCKEELDIDAIMGVERPPNRTMEVWRFFEMLAVGQNPVDVEMTMPFSCLVHLPNVFRCSDVSAYALTHVIMYLAEFGHDKATLGTVPESTDLVLEALTLRFMAEGHMDLAIELALCHAIVAGSASNVVDIVIDEAIRRVGTTGTVDMPASLMTSVIESVPETSKAWAQQYHTVLVLGALLEQRLRLTRENYSPNHGSLTYGADFRAKCLVMGEAISSISAYDLYRGGQIINLLSQSDATFKTEMAHKIALYISTLRKPDGYYGYYPDERRFVDLNSDRDYDLSHNQEMSKRECDALLQRFSLI